MTVLTPKRWLALGMTVAAVSFGAAAFVSAQVGSNDEPIVQPPGELVKAPDLTPDQERVAKILAGAKISVVDNEGRHRGWVDGDEYRDRANAGKLLAVHDDTSGAVVGYIGEYVIYVDKDVAEAPGFDERQYAKDHPEVASTPIRPNP